MKKENTSAFWITLVSCVLCAVALARIGAADDTLRASEVEKAFGKSIGANLSLGTNAYSSEIEATGASALVTAIIFGKNRELAKLDTQMNDLLEGESEFYWGGLRAWSSKGEWKNGAYRFEAGLPPVLMRAPIVKVPVGPITLNVDVGVAAEAAVDASLQPSLSYPLQYTSLRATLAPDIDAGAFAEGYARFLFVRAGAGGEIELIHSRASMDGTIYVAGSPPTVQFHGFLAFLKGTLYGFLDTWVFKWKRVWKPVFASWPGKCIPLDSGESDPCASQ